MDSIIHLQTVTSTNDEMLRLINQSGADALPEGLFIYADEQLKGRGQVGNHWEAQCGKNLLCTTLLFPDFVPADQQFVVTQMGALAVTDFLALFAGLKDATVKWPNDIYWADKKICGTLNEAMLLGRTIGYVMLGVGININQMEFTDYAPNPVSLAQVSGESYDIHKAALLFRQCLMQRYMQLVNGGEDDIRAGYMHKLYRREGWHLYEDDAGQRFLACVETVKTTGELLLKLKDGTIRQFLFKQVKHIIE